MGLLFGGIEDQHGHRSHMLAVARGPKTSGVTALPIFGGFHKWWYPQMDDLGVPPCQETPIIAIFPNDSLCIVPAVGLELGEPQPFKGRSAKVLSTTGSVTQQLQL